MRTGLLALIGALIPLAACGSSDMDDGAAHPGVTVRVEEPPEVRIDDEVATEVSVVVDLIHYGGPDAETFEVVSASLGLDLEHYADIELAIPEGHPPFAGLADGEELSVTLRGSIPDTHEDWGLCADPQAQDADEARVTLNMVLRVTPGANSDANEFELESLAVALHCTFTN